MIAIIAANRVLESSEREQVEISTGKSADIDNFESYSLELETSAEAKGFEAIMRHSARV